MKRRLFSTFFVIIFIWMGTAFFLPSILEAAESRGKGAGELPKELKGVRIRDSFIPSAGKPAGVIQTIIGHVVVAREGMRAAYYSAPGDRLYERDTLFTLKGSRCRFRLNGEDVVTLGDGTRITISSFSEDKTRGTKQSAFKMSNGKAMFYAMKLLRYKGAAMTVETPTAVVGVRGTKWGVEIVELEGKPTASRPILVADLSDIGFRHLAQVNQPNVQTNVYSFEGQIQVTSTTTGQTTSLSSGQGLNAGGAGLGNAFPTPPGVAQQFSSDTNAPGGTSSTTTTTTTTAGTSTTTTTTTTTTGGGTTTTTSPDTSTITQNQTTKDASTTATDTATDPGTNASGRHVGYVVGILTNRTGLSLEEIFASTKRQDFDGKIWGRGGKSTAQDYFRVDSGQSWPSTSDAYAKWSVFSSGTKNSGDLGTSHPISHTTTDYVTLENSRFEWGYWTMPDAFAVEGSNYIIDNRGWWINGPNTTNVSSLTGLARYSGNAYGTFWSSSGGTNMTGSFSSDLNFGTGAISNFALSASAYVNDALVGSASISGASGSVGSDAHFEITGGTWDLNGTTPTYKMAYGSLYGSSATYIGGAWGMATSSAAAVGIYEGSKYTRPSSHYGYFAMMLTNSSSYSFDSFLMSKSSSGHQNFAGVMSADDPFLTSTGYPAMTLNGGSPYTYSSPGITALKTAANNNLTIGVPVQITKTELGSNPYQEWGEWTQPATMTGCPSYTFNNKGYYVTGDVTPDSKMADLATSGLTAKYEGTANGTYWKSDGASNTMTGSFSSNVNFGTGAVTDFTVDVSGNGYAAKITGGSGSLSSGTGQKSNFNITSTTTVTLTGSTTNSAKAYGSVYGSNAQAIGGVWAIKGTGQQAVGVFQGTK